MPSNFSAPTVSRMTRESTWEATAESDPGGNVGLQQSGDDVHRWALGSQDQVDAGGAAKLGQPDQVLLNFKPAHHHQVGQLVDDERQEGHGVLGLGVVAGDVAGADFLHQLVAAEHLPHHRAEGRVDLFHVDDNRGYQVGDAVEGVSSTRLGSTINIRSWSGGLVNNREATIEFMQTLLPLPVAPAISAWGRAARSITTGAPPVSSPMAMGNPPLAVTEVKG